LCFATFEFRWHLSDFAIAQVASIGLAKPCKCSKHPQPRQSSFLAQLFDGPIETSGSTSPRHDYLPI